MGRKTKETGLFNEKRGDRRSGHARFPLEETVGSELLGSEAVQAPGCCNSNHDGGNDEKDTQTRHVANKIRA